MVPWTHSLTGRHPRRINDHKIQLAFDECAWELGPQSVPTRKAAHKATVTSLHNRKSRKFEDPRDEAICIT